MKSKERALTWLSPAETGRNGRKDMAPRAARVASNSSAFVVGDEATPSSLTSFWSGFSAVDDTFGARGGGGVALITSAGRSAKVALTIGSTIGAMAETVLPGLSPRKITPGMRASRNAPALLSPGKSEIAGGPRQ